MSMKDIFGRSRRGPFLIPAFQTVLIMLLTACLLIQAVFLSPFAHIKAHAEDSESISVTYPIYHMHTGNSGSGGGCYNIARTGTRSYEEPCGGTLYYWGDDWGTSECDRCGASYHGDRGGESCPHSETRYESYTYYEIGCGHSTSEVLGYVTYTRDTTNWATEVHVTMEITNYGMTLTDEPYVINGTGSADGEFTLTENGTYTFYVGADPNSNTGGAAYTIDVSNIDRYEPTVIDYSLEPTDWVREGVTLNLIDVRDIQPNGSEGCGLHELPYSYDNGATWTDDPTHFYTDNGDYEVLIRDDLENTAVLEFTIDNIDNEPPRILVFDYDHTPNLTEVTIHVECDDILSDGRDGVGLDDLPYSYDGGMTWTDKTEYTVTHNTTIEFRAKDKLGNIAVLDEAITNIDDYAPTVRHSLYPGYWTNGSVEVEFEAEDINPDGSPGIGLPDNCFSYDSGHTWTDEDSITVEDNCFVQVAVRDRNENINYYSLDVTNIDRISPVISASYVLINNDKAAILTAECSDGESGPDYNRFSWNGPQSGSGQSIVVTKDGTYTVTGYDKAGNSATASVNVSGVRFHILPVNTDITPIEPDAGSGLIKETEVNIQYPKIGSKSPVAELEPVSDDMNLWDRLCDWWNSLPIWLKALIILGLILLLAGLILLFILWYRCVITYNGTGDKLKGSDDEKYAFMGYRFIHTDNGSLALTIPETLWDKCATTAFRFKFNPLFAMIHKDEEIYISFPEDIVKPERITRFVDVLVR